MVDNGWQMVPLSVVIRPPQDAAGRLQYLYRLDNRVADLLRVCKGSLGAADEDFGFTDGAFHAAIVPEATPRRG